MTSPLTSGLVPHEAGTAEVSRREFQSRLAGIGNLNGKKMTEAEKEKKLREACEGFESIFIHRNICILIVIIISYKGSIIDGTDDVLKYEGH